MKKFVYTTSYGGGFATKEEFRALASCQEFANLVDEHEDKEYSKDVLSKKVNEISEFNNLEEYYKEDVLKALLFDSLATVEVKEGTVVKFTAHDGCESYDLLFSEIDKSYFA